MNVIRANDLARSVGISRRTMSHICKHDDALAFLQDGAYWVRMDVLAARPGMDIIKALLVLDSRKWIKATVFARISGISRKTVNNWVNTRPNFGVRLNKIWYLPIDMIAETEEQADMLETFAITGNWSQNERP